MSKISSGLYLLRTFGAGEIFRRLLGQVHSQTKMLLLEKDWDKDNDKVCEATAGIVFRDGREQDIENIIAAWPSEFADIAKDNKRLLKILQSRFKKNTPCFIAGEGEKVAGAVWCTPWHYDTALPTERRGRAAYEICNLFTTENARNKGVASGLLRFAMHQMARRGDSVAYSRILPERRRSIRVHEKVGFEQLGLLISGYRLGCRFSRLDATMSNEQDIKAHPEKIPKQVRKQTNPRPCVILAEGAVGSTIGMIRSIGSRYVPVYVFVVSEDEKLASVYRKSRYCKAAFTIRCALEASDVCGYVLEWLTKQDFAAKPVLMPITDKTCTYVAECREEFAGKFEICMPANDVVLNMLDKTKANALARECGLDVPDASSAATAKELEALADRVEFPVIVKPTWWRTRGEYYFKTKQCDNKKQLLEVGNQIINDGGTILVQQYIPGGDNSVEVYMFYRSRDGGTIYGCSGYKICQIPPGAGSMASGKAVWLPHVVETSDALLQQIDYRGLGGIEYKRCGDKSYFIEMSVRPEGFHALSIKAGVDLPWLAYSDMAGGGSRQKNNTQKTAYYITIRAYMSLWHRHRKQIPVLREMVKILSSGRVQLDLWSWRDPLPWAAQTGLLLKKILAKMKMLSRSPDSTSKN